MKFKNSAAAMLFSFMTLLTSCGGRGVPMLSPDVNLKNFADGKVGAVVSGCKIKYNDVVLFTSKITTDDCEAGWYLMNSNTDKTEYYIFDFNHNVRFLKPGVYNLYHFHAELGGMLSNHRSTLSSPASTIPYIFTDFIVEPGKIIYIGDLHIDYTKDTNLLIHILDMKYRNLKNIDLGEYESLRHLLKEDHISLSEIAKFGKTHVPMLE